MSSVATPQFGWAGAFEAQRAWQQIGDQFPVFHMFGPPKALQRTCAWDQWPALNFDINKTILVRQETGCCVSFGAAIAVVSVMIDEIVRLGESERLRIPFPPYMYGTSRLMPEGGNGRLRGAGSLGSWMANVIVKYGVLAADEPNVPAYSGRLADQWGNNKSGFQQFIKGASDHTIRTAARIRTIEQLADAVNNHYYCTIASNRGYSMRLKDDRGKSWFVGRDTWPHQMSILAVDTQPELCFYRRQQWGEMAHGPQLDGPNGGGWVTADVLRPELENEDCECYAFSGLNGFPTDEQKPEHQFI
jgi:hypothetical protein